MDLIAPTSHRDSEMINELLSRVTHGFDSPNSPKDSEIINELLSPVRMESTAQTALGTQK